MSTRQLLAAELNPRTTWGSTRFTDLQHVLLHFTQSDEWLTLTQSAKFYVLGRAIPITDNVIDFTPYGAENSGVSRRHAILTIDEEHVWLADLESVNGTFLNGHRLEPNKRAIVRDGDEIEMGHLRLHVYFAL
jgi:hypothetical protein